MQWGHINVTIETLTYEGIVLLYCAGVLYHVSVLNLAFAFSQKVRKNERFRIDSKIKYSKDELRD